jgi:hypothetical protein
VAPGPLTIAYGYVLPSVSPPGAYSIKLEAKTNTGAALFCFEANFHVNFFSGGVEFATPEEKAEALTHFVFGERLKEAFEKTGLLVV